MEKDYGRLSVEWHSDSLHGCRFDIFRRFADRTFFCKSDSRRNGIISVLIRMKGQIWREDNFSIPIGMKREGMFQELIMLSR